MADRQVTINVPDALAYDTVVVIVPLPKNLVNGAELKAALRDKLVASANDAVTEFIADNGIVWTSADRKAVFV